MKTLSLINLIILTVAFGHSKVAAQEAWLSTPESINQFRKQVESIKPDSSQYDIPTSDKTIQLSGREIDIRIYGSVGKELKPALIYVHGACWAAGSLDSHDEICRYLAQETGVKVIAIDYRLAPEYKYPSAHNDVYEATEWIWNHAGELGIDTHKFAISGESAGAYFAAATSLKARDKENSPQFLFQLLVYAALDGGGSSWGECKNLYFNNNEEKASPYGSPLWAENLTKLPPTYNIYGQYEIARAEQELFTRKLADVKVKATSYMHEKVGHDVINWMSVKSKTPAHKKAVEFIKMGFGE
ncbi:MAG: alpha/beta hydrolase [Bacteroidota bacterium]